MSASPNRTATRLQGVQEYYFSRKLTEIALRRAAGEDIVSLAIGNPDLPPPPGVIEALSQAAAKPDANGYQSYRGLTEWRAALKHWYEQTYGVYLDDAGLLPLAGSKEGIVHLALAYVEPGRALMHPDPGYPAYAAAAKLAGGIALPYPLPNSNDEPGEAWTRRLAAIVAGRDVALLFVNSPHMPTGQSLSDDQARALVTFAKTHDIILVSDNAYNYYADIGPRSLLSFEGALDCGVELNSLSKSHHMPGWRLGVLAGNPSVVQAALNVKSNLDSGQYLPIQRGAVEALATTDAWHEERNQTLRRRRVLGEELLRALGCSAVAGQSGLFVWAALPASASSAEAFADEVLDRTGLFLPPGTVFGPGGEGFMRLSLCASEAMLTDAIERASRPARLPVAATSPALQSIAR